MKRLILLAIIGATASLVGGYGLAAQWLGVGLAIVAGGVWLIAHRGEGWRFDWLMVVVFVGMGGAGVWGATPPMLMVVSLIGALSAWDLARFEQRLTQADRIDHESLMRRAHWQRLGLVAALGLALAGLALSLHLRLNLGWAIFLGLLIVIGLGQAAGGVFRGKH